MHIAFVVPVGDRKGHYGAWISKLCHSIAKQGHSVTVFTNKLFPEKYLKEKPSFNLIEVSNGKYAFEKYENKPNSFLYWYAYFRNSWKIPKLAIKYLQNNPVDVVFVVGAEYATFSLLLRYMRIKGYILPPIVWCIEAPNFTYHTYTGAWYKRLYKSIQRRIIKGVFGKEIKAIGTVTEWHKERLVEQLCLSNSFPVEVYGDGADEGNVIDKFEARRKLGIRYKGYLFLYLGIIRTDKGIEDLIKATLYLINIDVTIMIAGWPLDYTVDALNRMIDKYGDKNKIIARFEYIPEDELSLYYSACDAVIFPYNKTYTGGTGPLTKGACSYGKPVIITNVSGMYELVKKHRFGLIAEAKNPRSIAEKIIEFIALDEDQKRQLISNSLSFRKLCSWDNLAKKFITIAEKVYQDERTDKVYK